MDPWQGSQHVGMFIWGWLSFFWAASTRSQKPAPAQGLLPTAAAAFARRCRNRSGQFGVKTISSAGLGAESQARGRCGLQKVTPEEGSSSRGGMKREAEDETRFARGLRGARQLMSTQPPSLGMSTMQIKRLLAGRGGNGHAARPPTEEPSVSLTSALRFIPLHLQSGLQNPSSQLEAAGGVIGLHGACSTPCGALGWGCSVPILPSTRPRSRVSD